MHDAAINEVVLLYPGIEGWPAFSDRLRPYLERMAAGSGGRFLPEDLDALLACGQMQAWIAMERENILGLMITEIIPYPRLRAMRICGLVAHRPRRWLHFLYHVEHSAKVNFGCNIMEVCFHPHQRRYDRMLTTGGWGPESQMHTKALT